MRTYSTPYEHSQQLALSGIPAILSLLFSDTTQSQTQSAVSFAELWPFLNLNHSQEFRYGRGNRQPWMTQFLAASLPPSNRIPSRFRRKDSVACLKMWDSSLLQSSTLRTPNQPRMSLSSRTRSCPLNKRAVLPNWTLISRYPWQFWIWPSLQSQISWTLLVIRVAARAQSECRSEFPFGKKGYLISASNMSTVRLKRPISTPRELMSAECFGSSTWKNLSVSDISPRGK